MARITKHLLQSRTPESLLNTEYLDLANHNIVAIEKLNVCPNLKTLILRGNLIDSIQNLEDCREIWKLDLSYNDVRSLNGLCRFVALGTLTLSYNDLTWRELIKIRHLHIVNLSLHNNPQLERDPYYRIHVIDCLPNVWMLDGKLITSAERLQVARFFQESALKPHPVRQKVIREPFRPTQFKSNFIYGSKAVDMSSRFPAKDLQNVDSDRRKLRFMASDFQNELSLKLSHMKWQRWVDCQKYLVEDLLVCHTMKTESCNMLLLLLVVSLEFTIPSQLMRETLETAQLHNISGINTMELFNLNRQDRCHIVALLLAAAKIDRDSGKQGGLYDRLYLSLYYTVTELYKVANSDNVSRPIPRHKFSRMYHQYRCILAAEVSELLCVVPLFFDYIPTDQGINSLVTLATGNNQMCLKISKFLSRLKTREATDWKDSLEGIAEMIVSAVKRNMSKMFADEDMEWNLASSHILFHMKYLPMKRPQSSPAYHNDYLVTGRATPDTGFRAKTTGTRFRSQGEDRPTPALGDVVLLGPQNTSSIIGIPEDGIAMVYVGEITAENGGVVPGSRSNSEQQYQYIDMSKLHWDQNDCQWKPIGCQGDRITIQIDDEYNNNNNNNMSTKHTQSDPNKSSGSELPAAMSSVLREKLDLKLNMNMPPGEHKLWTVSDSLVDGCRPDDDDDIDVDIDQPKQHPPTPDPIMNDADGDDVVIDEVSTSNHMTDGEPETIHTTSPTPLLLPTVEEPTTTNPPPSVVTTIVPTTTSDQQKNITTAESNNSSELLTEPSHITVKELKMEILNYSTRIEPERNLSDLRSFYQKQREEVWKKTANIIHSDRSVSPLLQPPCSPTVPFGHPLGHHTNRTQSAKSFRRVDGSSPRKVKMVNNWLAGGKDLHQEKLSQRPKSADLHLPGWIEGLDDKAKSLAIAKMLRRTQIHLSPTTSHWAIDYDRTPSSRVSSATVTIKPFGSNTPREQMKCHDCWTVDSRCQSGRRLKSAARNRPATSITYQWT